MYLLNLSLKFHRSGWESSNREKDAAPAPAQQSAHNLKNPYALIFLEIRLFEGPFKNTLVVKEQFLVSILFMSRFEPGTGGYEAREQPLG